MLQRRTWFNIAMISLVVTSLAACGIGGTSGTSSSNESSATDLNTAIGEVTDEQLQGTSITMARFFGDCAETTDGITDMSKATTECEAIQILTNKFVEENEWGITIERMGGASWHSYYDGLNTAMASSDKPDIAIMHGSNLPDYADRNLLVEVPESMGIDLSDATKPAQEAVTYDGVEYAVPFDTHALVSHLNLTLLKEAGLTDADGTYTMPTSTEEFLADAKIFKEKTGKTFFDVAMTNDPMASRLWMTSLYQQDVEIIDAETGEVNMNISAANTALQFINTLVDEGYTDPTHDYDASQQAFLLGNSAIMYNGVWAVNQYDAEAPFDYAVTNAPMLFETDATWANSHVWAVPAQDEADPVKYRASFEFAKYLYEHTADWAIATGHMPSNQTALDSEEYLAAPHRTDFLETATNYGKMAPRVVAWPSISDTIQEKIEATWLNGADIGSTLDDLQQRVEKTVNE